MDDDETATIEDMAWEALDALPTALKAHLNNLAVGVEGWATDDDYRQADRGGLWFT